MNLLAPLTPIQNVASPLFKPVTITPGDDGIDRLRVGGIEFALEFSDYSQKTTEDRIVLCKPQVMLDSYLHLFSSVPHARIVELELKPKLAEDEREVLENFLEIKRKKDPFWGR